MRGENEVGHVGRFIPKTREADDKRCASECFAEFQGGGCSVGRVGIFQEYSLDAAAPNSIGQTLPIGERAGRAAGQTRDRRVRVEEDSARSTDRPNEGVEGENRSEVLRAVRVGASAAASNHETWALRSVTARDVADLFGRNARLLCHSVRGESVESGGSSQRGNSGRVGL